MRKTKFAALIALSLIAVACSDGGGSGGSDATTDVTDGGATETTVTTGGTRTLKIGYAYQDVSAFTILNDKFSIGDPELQGAAVLEAWRRDGVLPMNGIDIEFVYVKFNTLSADDQLGACTRLAQDEQVFAVIATRDFQVGSSCLTERYGIPTITSSGMAVSAYERGAPWLFSVQATETQAATSFVQWAQERGDLDGKRIGLYWDTRSEEAADAFKAALADLGIELASDLPSDGEGIGSPQDQIVVQRFLADGVDLPIMMVGTSSVTNFLASAEQQGYEPNLLWFEWSNQLNDVSTDAFPQSMLDGVQAMAMSRVGELAAGIEPGTSAAACIANYQSFAGVDVELVVPASGETGQILFTCDLMTILLEGLRNAGDDPTPESFVASLEMITDLELAWWGNLSYSADDHAGVEQIRTVTWSTDCPCWTAEGELTDVNP